MDSTLTTFPKFTVLACAALMMPQTYAWSPGAGNESAASGFEVDTHSRNDVISFWNSVYHASEGYQSHVDWTGSINGNDIGSTSTAFRNDVLRRINYYRAMAGMKADIVLNGNGQPVSGGSGPDADPGSNKEAAAQAAAFMLSANTEEFWGSGGVANGTANPHNPPEAWIADSDTARNGAYYSNIAIGHYGPDAIDAYISEDAQGAGGAENSDVGHRRYIFHSRLQEVATGDVVPTDDSHFPANALYVLGNWLPATNSPSYVSWPNAGFIPEALVPRLWSLSFPGADFSNAAVTMEIAGGQTISTTITSRSEPYADNTIVWKAVDASSIPSAQHEDVTIHLSISNILINGSATSHSYSVTIINPERLDDYPTLSGNTSPPLTGANYVFNEIEHAEEYEFDVSAISPASWVEGAEDSSSDHIVDQTSSNYSLRARFTWNYNQSQFWRSGSKAFHLAFPNNNFPFTTEIFTLDHTVVPENSAALSFHLRRGYMTPETKLEVQYSADGGGSWSTIKTYAGNNTPDSGFSHKIVALPTSHDEIMIRFMMHRPTSTTGVFNIVDHAGYPIGVYIDDVEFLDCGWLERLSLTHVPKYSNGVSFSSEFTGGSIEAGKTYLLRIRPKIGKVWMPFGDSLEVVPVESSGPGNYLEWAQTNYPLIGSFNEDYDKDGLPNGLEYLLKLNPLDANDAELALSPAINGGRLEISHPVISGGSIEAEYSLTLEEGSWQPVTVTISADSIATASVELSGSSDRCFIRWKATEL